MPNPNSANIVMKQFAVAIAINNILVKVMTTYGISEESVLSELTTLINKPNVQITVTELANA